MAAMADEPVMPDLTDAQRACEHPPERVSIARNWGGGPLYALCEECSAAYPDILTAQREEIETLRKLEAKAWGIRYCCTAQDCGCLGMPIDPPSWWRPYRCYKPCGKCSSCKANDAMHQKAASE